MNRWRRNRGRIAIVLALLLALVVAWWTVRDKEQYDGLLDPRSTGPAGAQALAKVLAAEGVDVEIVRSAAGLARTHVDDDTTVVVTQPRPLSPGTLRRLREHAGPGRLILVDPSYALLQSVDEGLDSTRTSDTSLTARCREGVAGVDVGDLRLEVDRASAYDGAGCFRTPEGPVLRLEEGHDLILFGAGEALSNDQVLRADNAAIALRLLGHTPHLVWYVPDPADATGDDAMSLADLLPDWIAPGLWLGAIAALGLVGWRVRRLGRLSSEPLPVVVRAIETTRSRGRLYRKAGDRAHAAQSLRRAARTDLAAHLGLDRGVPPERVVDAVSEHLGVGRDELSVTLTDAHPPASDGDLVALARELARLRKEVRRR